MTLLILASSSVVRKKILENSMIKVDKIIAPDIDEKFSAKEKPEDVAKRLAQEKAQNIDVTTYDDAIIICADTIVAKGRKILDKALTDDDVRKFAKLKSGSKISCFTGLCVMQVKNGVITSIKSR